MFHTSNTPERSGDDESDTATLTPEQLATLANSLPPIKGRLRSGFNSLPTNRETQSGHAGKLKNESSVLAADSDRQSKGKTG